MLAKVWHFQRESYKKFHLPSKQSVILSNLKSMQILDVLVLYWWQLPVIHWELLPTIASDRPSSLATFLIGQEDSWNFFLLTASPTITFSLKLRPNCTAGFPQPERNMIHQNSIKLLVSSITTRLPYQLPHDFSFSLWDDCQFGRNWKGMA